MCKNISINPINQQMEAEIGIVAVISHVWCLSIVLV